MEKDLATATFFELGLSVDLCDRLEKAGYRVIGDLGGKSASKLIREEVFHYRREALVVALALSGSPLPKGLKHWSVQQVLRELELEVVPEYLLRRVPQPRTAQEPAPTEVPAAVWNRAVHDATSGAHFRKPRHRRGF